MREARAIKIAIMALGGQGGGVLTDWIIRAGEECNYLVQATSVPGVAQRTGATIYYLELFPCEQASARNAAPVLALMPAPGDVDILLACELMEAGRGLLRGFITKNTNVIASSHREFAIAEKIAPGDGRRSGDDVIAEVKDGAGQLIVFDMAKEADAAHAVISAVMFGALAGSNCSPISVQACMNAMGGAGKMSKANEAAFKRGYELAGRGAPKSMQAGQATLKMESDSLARGGKALSWLAPSICEETRAIIAHGWRKTVDFQDRAYGELYLGRVRRFMDLDAEHGGKKLNWRLTQLIAKHLALWMSYEDAIRVASLKIRKSRFEQFRRDVFAAPGQIVHIKEYLHPRVEEICDILPAPLARTILASPILRKCVQLFAGNGRRISTNKLRGFLLLGAIARLRFLRRGSYRFHSQTLRIESWLALIEQAAARDYALACEIAALQQLLKGYGETHERGLRKFEAITDRLEIIAAAGEPARQLAQLRELALSQESDEGLLGALKDLSLKNQHAA